MADYIQLDGKRYKISSMGDDSYQNIWNRPKTYDEGLTGLTIIQDFTVPDGGGGERMPRNWSFLLRVFINDPWPDSNYGVWADLLAAYNKSYVVFIEHDGTTTHNVGIQLQLMPIPRVPANIEGLCNGIFYVTTNLVKVYQ